MSHAQLDRSIWKSMVVVVPFALVFALRGSGFAGEQPRAAVTYAKDVAPILQKNCQTCHQPGSIAPMALLSYDDAKQYAELIKSRVAAREMPPWHIDKTVGIQSFKNDRSLSDQEIATIVQWVDGGTPRGDDKDLPPPVTMPKGDRWQLAEQNGEPDLVIKSKPFTVPARGQDKWWHQSVETGLTEPRWVRAIEIKPSYPMGKKVVHHALTLLQQPEQGLTNMASTMTHSDAPPVTAGLFMEWALGKSGEIFNANAGKLMLPDSRIRWEVHYYAAGEEVKDDIVELGVWFYPKGTVPKYRTILRMFDASAGELDISPNSVATTTNSYVLPAPTRLENFQPHMHMRGKAMTMEAVYPDGRRETLSRVNNFQWKWHVNYIYADDVAPLLPKGTRLIFTAVHDNTAKNKNNPDPAQWIGWGDRTVDEMAHVWVDVTYLEQDDFDRMVAERKAKAAKNP